MSTSRPVEAVNQQIAPERSAARLMSRWADPAAVVLYLVLAFWVTYRLWRNAGALALVNNDSDVHFFEWALIHATRIFTHGENPLFTPQMNAPDGVNLMANTGLLGLTVPLVPVTLLFGPAVAFTVMLTGGLTATAWAWYHVLSRHIVGFWPAAVVGGLFAGFAPGMINHVNGHPNLVNQFLIPFIVWRAISLRTARDGVVLGLLVTWQAFLNEELLFMTGLAVAVFVVAYTVFRPAEVRARLRPFLAGLWPALPRPACFSPTRCGSSSSVRRATGACPTSCSGTAPTCGHSRRSLTCRWYGTEPRTAPTPRCQRRTRSSAPHCSSPSG